MVVHRLIPLPDGEAALRGDVKARCPIVVGDGDGQINHITPRQGGVKRKERCAYTAHAVPREVVRG